MNQYVTSLYFFRGLGLLKSMLLKQNIFSFEGR
jgi:hypothetical protein